MNVLFEQILRIEDGVVACDAEDDLVDLAGVCLRDVLMQWEHLPENRPTRGRRSESAS